MALRFESDTGQEVASAPHRFHYANVILSMVMWTWNKTPIEVHVGMQRYSRDLVSEAHETLPSTWVEFTRWYRAQPRRCQVFDNAFSTHGHGFVRDWVEETWNKVRELIRQAAETGQPIDCQVCW